MTELMSLIDVHRIRAVFATAIVREATQGAHEGYRRCDEYGLQRSASR